MNNNYINNNYYDYNNYDDNYWMVNYNKLTKYKYRGYKSHFCYILKTSVNEIKNEKNKNKYTIKKKFKKEFLELLFLDTNKEYYIISIYNIINNMLCSNNNIHMSLSKKNILYYHYQLYLNDIYFNINKSNQIYYLNKQSLLNFIKSNIIKNEKQINTTQNKNKNNKYNFNINENGKKLDKLII